MHTVPHSPTLSVRRRTKCFDPSDLKLVEPRTLRAIAEVLGETEDLDTFVQMASCPADMEVTTGMPRVAVMP